MANIKNLLNNLTNILESKDVEGKNFYERAEKIFKRMSSGHSIVLLTITKLIEVIEEKSLILLDEPEGHLHPPLLSAFTRALSILLRQKNAVAIVSTHSPVVLQEVPKSCVWALRRSGRVHNADRLEIETFGESVGTLTREVFGLEVTNSGFFTILKSLSEKYSSLDEIFEALTLGQLGIEKKPIGILNTNGFFNFTLKQLDVMVAEGYLKQSNKDMLLVGNSVEELLLKMENYQAPEMSKVINKVVR